jgi:hypothetical protein
MGLWLSQAQSGLKSCGCRLVDCLSFQLTQEGNRIALSIILDIIAAFIHVLALTMFGLNCLYRLEPSEELVDCKLSIKSLFTTRSET